MRSCGVAEWGREELGWSASRPQTFRRLRNPPTARPAAVGLRRERSTDGEAPHFYLAPGSSCFPYSP